MKPNNAFPALKYTEHITREDTDLTDDTEIIGLLQNGVGLAWPINNMLVPHHLANDKVGEAAVLASYCPICRSGMVYSAEIDRRRLTFEVAGLWRKNMIIRDLETNTLWQQATGEAVYGKFKGRNLPILFSEQMTWGAWKEEHPETLLAREPKDVRKSFLPRKMLLEGPRLLALPGLKKLDRRLPSHEEVFGVIVDETSKAYPLSAFLREPIMRDKVGHTTVRLQYYMTGNSIKAFKSETNEPILVYRHWWHAWSEFHPDTLIYRE